VTERGGRKDDVTKRETTRPIYMPGRGSIHEGVQRRDEGRSYRKRVSLTGTGKGE